MNLDHKFENTIFGNITFGPPKLVKPEMSAANSVHVEGLTQMPTMEKQRGLNEQRICPEATLSIVYMYIPGPIEGV